VEPDHVIDGSDGKLRILDRDRRMIADFGHQPKGPSDRPLMPLSAVRAAPEDHPPALGTGWITYASWLNTTGTPISQFTSIWVVPPAPSTHDGQLLYLFNGMQNADHIYQPVLQWGRSPAGGGDFWSVATWYVGPPGGDVFHTAEAVRVEPGRPLIGVMTLEDQTSSGFSYTGGFFGVADSGYQVQNIPELTWLIETLEAYSVVQCSDYPPVNRTTFSGIDIKQGTSRPNVVWTANDAVVDCGQHTVIHNNSASGGSVDLWYQTAPRVDDIVFWNNGKAYLCHGSTYARYDVAADRMDPGYPLPIAGNWPGLIQRFTDRLDAIVMWTNGKAYIFKGNQYCRYDVATDQADPGYPLRISGNWPGFPPAFEASIDAGVVWPNGKAYFFKGDQYIRYDIATDRTDPGYPLPIAGNWPGMPTSFSNGVDAIVVWNNGKAYILKGKQYCRYDIAADRVDPGYPLPIAGNWPGLPADYT
jgi:hemopexin